MKDIWRKKKGANAGGKQSEMERSDNIYHSSLYLYCCGRMIGRRVFMGIFEISLTGISINTLLCNPNYIHSESFLLCSRGHR